MNKTILIDHVANSASISKVQSEKVINGMLEGITDSLKQGKDARFVGFGTFTIGKRKARTGRNPRTGAEIKIAASKVACFRVGKALKDAINQ